VTATVIWNLLVVAYLGAVLAWPHVQHEVVVIEITILFWVWLLGKIALACAGAFIRRVRRKQSLTGDIHSSTG
jgi:hypothetical protein